MIWLLFLSANLLIVYCLFNMYVGYRSPYWPQVTGYIKHSGVVVRVNTASSSKNKHYHPAVLYEYEVGGKKYKNNKIGNYIGFGNDEEFANDLISHYPEGEKAKVYYWPVYPKVSFLSPGMNQALANYILLFTGMFVAVGAAPSLFTENPTWFIDKIFGFVEYVT